MDGNDLVLTFLQNADEAIWTGAVDSDWLTAGNWQNSIIPDSDDAVTIPSGVVNQPVIESGDITVAEIWVGSGNTFTLNDGAELTLSGGENGLTLFGDAATIAGYLTINNQSGGSNGITLFNGVLTVPVSGDIILDGIGIGAFLTTTMNIAGEVEINAPVNTGIDFGESADLHIEEIGIVEITDAGNSGAQLDGEILIEGAFSIDGSAANGLIINSTKNLTIGENGTLEIINNGFSGITRTGQAAVVDNSGLLVIIDNGDNASDRNNIINNASATLRAEGVIDNGTVSFATGSNLFPGASPGCLTVRKDADLSGAVITLELEGTTACDDYDQLIIEATSDVSNATLLLSGSYEPAVNDVFTILKNDGVSSITGTFAGLPEGSAIDFNNASLLISYIGGAGGDITLTAVSVLPLDLLSFTGETVDKQNRLTWTTANEEDFSHFEVERSEAGIDWESVGNITGDQSGFYQFQEEAITAYYRLKIVDLDGTFAYSEVVFLESDLGAAAGAMLVFPNPSNGQFTVNLVQVPHPAGESGKLTLRDLNGRIIWTTTVESEQHEVPVALNAPKAGLYTLSYISIAGVVTRILRVQ